MKIVGYVQALNSGSVFPDDLVRKIDGKSLTQRVIENAKKFDISSQDIHVHTNSEEVALNAERAGAIAIYESDQFSEQKEAVSRAFEYCKNIVSTEDVLLKLSPYSPLLEVQTLKDALAKLLDTGADVIIGTIDRPVSEVIENHTTIDLEFQLASSVTSKAKSDAFSMIRGCCFGSNNSDCLRLDTISIKNEFTDIRNSQDWWVCEKHLQRKRVIFRVIGNDQVGMGHIYRSLTLAHELIDHEIIFVADLESKQAVKDLVNRDYRIEVFDRYRIVDNIVNLKPDLVINDILNTSRGDVLKLQSVGTRVINFEDLGDGAPLANTTINELYDFPTVPGENIRWGSNYYFVRDEFVDAQPCEYSNIPKGLLLVFGGTDPNDLTRAMLLTINHICLERSIPIHVVTGPGYRSFNRLVTLVETMDGVSLTHVTGVISKIMEKVSIAITSNGRTVYEMAHMNIPAIVIPQHDRERTHTFATLENGFVALETYKKGHTEDIVAAELIKILDNHKYRKSLFDRTVRHRFSENKFKVVELVKDALITSAQ